MVSFWQYYPDIHSFQTLADDRKEEILKSARSLHAMNHYNFETVVRDLIGQLQDKEIIFELFANYLKGSRGGYTENAYQITESIYTEANGKQKIKDMIVESGKPFIVRALLFLDDISAKEEELGLRALASTKYAPTSLHVRKYKPSVEAINKLPPVTRLKVFETLLNNDHLAYNILENFSDPEEFKALLFSAAFRHLERAQVIVERYEELVLMGQEATVTVKVSCENCGDYSIAISSGRVRTFAGLKRAQIGPYLMSNSCVLCGMYSKCDKQVICP